MAVAPHLAPQTWPNVSELCGLSASRFAAGDAWRPGRGGVRSDWSVAGWVSGCGDHRGGRFCGSRGVRLAEGPAGTNERCWDPLLTTVTVSRWRYGRPGSAFGAVTCGLTGTAPSNSLAFSLLGPLRYSPDLAEPVESPTAWSRRLEVGAPWACVPRTLCLAICS